MDGENLTNSVADEVVPVTNVLVDAVCPVCQVGGSKRHLCKVGEYRVVVCDYCDTDFIYPMPTEMELQNYYDSQEYFEGGVQGGYDHYDQQTTNVLELFGKLLDRFPNKVGLSILDLGCAYGTQLAIAAKRGWKCFGVEISRHARNTAVQRLGPNATIVKDVNELPSGYEFDLIVMLDVLEHLPDPYKMFTALYRKGLVGEKTTVAITTPNARSLDAIKSPSGWAYRHPPSHLVYYSTFSLQYLLERAWFSDVQISGVYPLVRDISPDMKSNKYAGLMAFASASRIKRQIDSEGAWLNDKDLLTSQVYRLRSELGNSLECILNIETKDKSKEETIHALQYEVQSKDETIHALQNEVQSKDETIHALQNEVQSKDETIHALQNTKLYRLANVIRNQPMSLSKVKTVIYLTGALLLPGHFKTRLRRFRLSRKSTVNYNGVKFRPYQVRQQTAVLESRPRILHVIANFMTGGSSRLVVDLVERLGGKYEQEIITSYLPAPAEYHGLTIREFPKNVAADTICREIARFQPDLVHVHYWGNVDYIWYDTAMRAAQQMGCNVVENINTPVAPYISESVMQYVYVSHSILDEFSYKTEQDRVIYPGSDFSRFMRSPQQPAPQDCIGMVYRLESDKLNARSIQPFIEVARRRPNTKILIIGGGSLLKPYQEAVQRAGVSEQFEFTGYVAYEDLPAFYARMSVFVAPVWKESFGQVTPFAMNMGIPCVGYNVGALAEIIGNEGLLAPAGDCDKLAEIIIDLLNNPEKCTEIGEFNQQRASELFSVETMTDSYDRLYAELLEISK